MTKRRKLHRLISPGGMLCILIITLLLVFAFPLHARAATIVVNTTGDVRAEDGQCSLSEAIIAANTDTASGVTPGESSAGSGSDVIALGAQTYTLTIGGVSEDSGLTGDLDVTTNLTINGAGLAQTIIDGGGLDQVIEVMHNVNLSLNGLSIQNDFGGFSGGISNEGLLTLSGVSVSNNDGIGIGSAHDWANRPLYPAVDLINSIVAGNTSTGIHSFNTTLVLDQSIVDGNQDGGIFASESVTIVDSTISENSSSSTGGGIAIINGYSDVIVRSTINGNTATGDGGGIYFWGFTVWEKTTSF